MLAKYVLHPQTYKGTKKKNIKAVVHKAEAWDIKKEATDPTVQN
jgi:hypothetical protein